MIFIVSLIPLYLIGGYAHPSVDDYYYGVETSRAWAETHSVLAVFRTSFSEMIRTYNEWQGNFAAVFLMQLQPAIFGEEYYVIAPLLLISTFAVSTIFFYHTMLTNLFRAVKYTSLIISLCITFVSLQLTHTPSDSFCWYNGAIYYTFFHSLMLLLFSLMARLWTSPARSHSLTRRIPSVLFCSLLSFAIEGGNFPTALLTAILLILVLTFSIYCCIKKHNKPTFSLSACYALISIFFFVAFILSLTAPGNVIRQASVGGNTGLVKTFLFTFAYGGYSLSNLLSAPCIMLFCFLTPSLYSVAKKMPWTFRHPFLVFIFTFCLYCSLGTPVFFAQDLRMPYRIMNIIYFSGYSLITFNLLYVLGWLEKIYHESKLLTACEAYINRLLSDKRKLLLAFCSCLMIFAVTCVGQIEVTETSQGNASFSNLPASASAVYSILTGEAASYDRELNERAEYLSSTEETHVCITPLNVQPELIFHTDITEDPTHWKNAHLASYYGKEAVQLIP